MMLFTATGLAAYILARHRLAFIFVSLLCTVPRPPAPPPPNLINQPRGGTPSPCCRSSLPPPPLSCAGDGAAPSLLEAR